MQEASNTQKFTPFNVLECEPSRRIFLPSISVAYILPQYIEEYQYELEQQGEAIDAENARLLAEEAFWLRLYLNPNISEYHDKLLSKLDSVRQQLTNLSLKLTEPSEAPD